MVTYMFGMLHFHMIMLLWYFSQLFPLTFTVSLNIQPNEYLFRIYFVPGSMFVVEDWGIKENFILYFWCSHTYLCSLCQKIHHHIIEKTEKKTKIIYCYDWKWASPMVQQVKNPPAMQETQETLVSGLGRSPGGGNGNPLQYSCLENSMDRGD